VKEDVLDNAGHFRLEKVRSGLSGPEFFLAVGKEWVRRIRVTKPGDQHFEFTLAPGMNDIVPDVSFTDVSENQPVSLRRLRGHVLYLEFWATWCGPCQGPMLRLSEMMRRRPRSWDGHVDVLAASIDDDRDAVKRYVERKGWTSIHHVWAGVEGQTDFDSPAALAFGVNGVPCAFLIAADGRIVWKGHPKDANPETQIDELYRSMDKTSDKTK
jgi:thiol-disulfide isomerase/thioredoxin